MSPTRRPQSAGRRKRRLGMRWRVTLCVALCSLGYSSRREHGCGIARIYVLNVRYCLVGYAAFLLSLAGVSVHLSCWPIPAIFFTLRLAKCLGLSRGVA